MSERSAVMLIGHGSRRGSAAETLEALARMLGSISGHPVVHAYMQFAEPTVGDAVKLLVNQGASRIVLLPVFLYRGQHVAEDVPAIVDRLGQEYPEVRFVLGEPLGADHRLAEILNERLASVLGGNRNGDIIAGTSFKIIESAAELPEDPELKEIAARVVHTTGDRLLGRSLLFSPQAVRRGIEAILAGLPIVTDVAMVRAGISHGRLAASGNRVLCGLDFCRAEGSVQPTRTAAGLANALREFPRALVAVGNAPTALTAVCELVDNKSIDPPLVIGTPVGFVGAVEAKALLTGKPVEYITLPGTRGGSPVAAAIVNALAGLAIKRAGRNGN